MDTRIELTKPLTKAVRAFMATPFDAVSQRALKLKAALVFMCGLLLGVAGGFWVDQSEVEQHKLEARAAASVHAHLLEQQLVRSMSATYALAAVLRQGNGQIEDFEALATQMLPMYGGLSALQLAPNGVIRQIVPRAGHEAALGHDLLEDPERNREAFLALTSRALTLAGPFELRQGGKAVVGRLPVFLDVGKRDEHFWGFATALIRIPDLLRASALTGDSAKGHEFELTRVLAGSGEEQSIWRSTEAPIQDAISIPVKVPNGIWTLKVVRSNGWHLSTPTLIWLGLAVLAVSVLLALQVYHLMRQPLLLSQQVAARTAELNEANQSLQTEIFQHWQTELALRESERWLEQRVEVRTRELEEANAALLLEQTEQKELIVKLADTRSQLLQSRMMAAVGQLAAGVAHEINNPLAFVISNVAVMQRDVGVLRETLGDRAALLTEDLLPMLQESLEGLYRVRDIVQNLREFSSVDCCDEQALDVNRCLHTVLALMSRDIGDRIDVFRDFGEVPIVRGSVGQMNQVFRHILLNAVQAISGAGEIRISTRLDGEFVQIDIADTGCGIEPEQMSHVFEPFFSTREVGQGKGLGLAVAYHVVHSHGGDIAVVSEPGKGARFTVRLPVHIPPAEVSQPAF